MVTKFEANEDYLMTVKLINDEVYTFQISAPQMKSIKSLHCITLTDTSGGKAICSVKLVKVIMILHKWKLNLFKKEL